MKWERIIPQTLSAEFCPCKTLYSWEQGIWESLPFSEVYHKLISAFGRPVQWRNNVFKGTMPTNRKNLWWVNHEQNLVYLTTEAQFIYCKLVFEDVTLQEVG